MAGQGVNLITILHNYKLPIFQGNSEKLLIPPLNNQGLSRNLVDIFGKGFKVSLN